jgi:predicted permease
MNMSPLRRVLNLWRRRALEREFDEELGFHFDARVAANLRRGMTGAEAEAEARRHLGSPLRAREGMREARVSAWLEELARDLRHSLRALRRTPAFTSVAVVTLALGIGANTAMFSVIDAVLLEPLPYRDPDRLIRLFAHLPADESPTRAPLRPMIGLSFAELQELRARTRTLSAAALSTVVFATWIGETHTYRVEGARVSPALFEMLGVRPSAGRFFTSADEAAGADVIVLSHGMWQQYFAGDRSVLGRTIRLEPQGLGNAFSSATARSYTVVGVMPDGFEFDGRPQFWLPFSGPTGSERPLRGILIGQLRPGVAAATAATDLGTIIAPMRKHSARVVYEAVREQHDRVAAVKAPLLVLMAAVGLVLLIASVNVANLLLARTASRHHEIAVRTALGAGRARIVGHLLTESVLLALIGGAAGIVLAFGGIRLLQVLAETLTRIDTGIQVAFPRFETIRVDAEVLIFTALVSVITGALFGLGPAFRYSRSRPAAALRDRAVTGAGGPRRTQDALVLAQVGLAVLLLIGAGLLMRSFDKLTRVDSGYRAENLLTFQVALPQRPTPALVRFSEELVARLRSLPDVQAAAYARQLPIVQVQESASFRRTPAVPEQPGPPGADARLVGGDYFAALGISVRSGRGLTAQDDAGQPRVVVINETLARRDFAGEQPVGQQVYIGRDALPWQIVGVVADVRQFGPARPADPQFFADIRQWPAPNEAFIGFLGPYYAVRTRGSSAAAAAAIDRALQQTEANATLHNVATMERLVDHAVARPRLYSVLLGLFAAIAAALAMIGVYGVMTYAVAQRIREIGIRVALGAGRSQILGMILRHTVAVSAGGLILGTAGAAGLTRYLEGMLFGVTRLDPVTFAAAPIGLAVAALLASYVPARRAMAVNPVETMRAE